MVDEAGGGHSLFPLRGSVQLQRRCCPYCGQVGCDKTLAAKAPFTRLLLWVNFARKVLVCHDSQIGLLKVKLSSTEKPLFGHPLDQPSELCKLSTHLPVPIGLAAVVLPPVEVSAPGS